MGKISRKSKSPRDILNEFYHNADKGFYTCSECNRACNPIDKPAGVGNIDIRIEDELVYMESIADTKPLLDKLYAQKYDTAKDIPKELNSILINFCCQSEFHEECFREGKLNDCGKCTLMANTLYTLWQFINREIENSTSLDTAKVRAEVCEEIKIRFKGYIENEIEKDIDDTHFLTWAEFKELLDMYMYETIEEDKVKEER